MLRIQEGAHVPSLARKEDVAMLERMKTKLLGVGVGLALIGATVGGGIAVHAQTSPPATTSPSATATVNGPEQEGPETANVEKAEPNEPALPDGGHQDQAGVDVQHEFSGIE
jgi:hypothetical protein